MLKLASLTVAIGLFLSASAGWAQDAEAGKSVFKKCKACHEIGPDAKNKAGPVLNDLVGSQAGIVEGFKFRPSIVAAGEKGLVWTVEDLVGYLEDPTKYLKAFLDDEQARSGMSFKLRNEQDRLDVVSFLKTAGLEDSAIAQPEVPIETRTEEEVIADQVFTAEFLEDPVNFEAGKEIWFAQCTHCHGYKAYPGKAPKLKPRKYKPSFVFKRTYKGFKKMPSWKDVFTIDEIRQVVVYVKGKGFAP